MKILKISFLALAVGSLLFFSNCKKGGGKDEPSEKELKTEILVSGSPWVFESASIDDGTATDESDWDQLSISFTTSEINTTGGYPQATKVWPTKVAWTGNDDISVISRADGVDMTVLELTQSKLQVSFTLTDAEINARTASLDGDYIFTFSSSKTSN